MTINYKFELDRWLKSERDKLLTKKPFSKKFIGSRGYPHFDAPISLNNAKAIGQLSGRLSNPNVLAHWPFYPFLTKYQRVRRYRHNQAASTDGSPPVVHRDQKEQTHIKSRPIMVAAHQDACVFAFFAYLLTEPYETVIKKERIDDNVVAYRSIHASNNVDFAKKAFGYMQSTNELTCLLIDIKGFFDNINHDKLRKLVCSVLGTTTLPDELNHVFRNITAYRFANEDNVVKEIKRQKKHYLTKIAGAGQYRRICKTGDFNRYIDNSKFVHKNTKGIGIPQGSPVSGILANISLLEFDCWVRDRISNYDVSFYQRYSDDIIIVCPPQEAKQLYVDILQKLKDSGVKASARKTEVFFKSGDTITNIVKDIESGASESRQNIQYLGLEWNGKQIVLRPSTVTRRLRPQRKLDRKYWKYNRMAIDKIADSRALRRQFAHIRRTLKSPK
jgi:RNA-directed DNA polymerase